MNHLGFVVTGHSSIRNGEPSTSVDGRNYPPGKKTQLSKSNQTEALSP